jgi:hypothetical protein
VQSGGGCTAFMILCIGVFSAYNGRSASASRRISLAWFGLDRVCFGQDWHVSDTQGYNLYYTPANGFSSASSHFSHMNLSREEPSFISPP